MLVLPRTQDLEYFDTYNRVFVLMSSQTNNYIIEVECDECLDEEKPGEG